MELDYRYLRAFHLTAKYLSFSKAAKELKIAQSAISRQIKLLEENIGSQLIVRSSKKVLLTEQGIKLLQSLEHFEKSSLEIFTNHTNQNIRIGILHGLLETWFCNIMKNFNKNHQNPLHITVGAPEFLKEQLGLGLLDIVIGTDNIQSELVSSLKLFQEKLILINKNQINNKELEKYTWIVYNDEDHLFKASKKRSEQIHYVNSITAIVKLVKKGLGIAIVPDHIVKDTSQIFSNPVKGISPPTIYLSTLNYKKMPIHLKNLIDIIKTT